MYKIHFSLSRKIFTEVFFIFLTKDTFKVFKKAFLERKEIYFHYSLHKINYIYGVNCLE